MNQKRQGWVFLPKWTVDQFWSALSRHVIRTGYYRLSSLQNPVPGGVQRSKLFWIDAAAGKESLLCDIEVSVKEYLPRIREAAESSLCEAKVAVKEGRPWVELRVPLGAEAEDAKRAELFWKSFCQAEGVEDQWVAQAEFGMTWRDEIEWMKQLRMEPTEEFQRRLEAMRVLMWDGFGVEVERGVKADEQAEPQADSGSMAEQLTLAEDEEGKKPGPIDTKLDALLAGQTAIREDLSGLRRAVLARFDTSEQTIITAVIERLDQVQLATVETVLDAIEAGLVPIDELEETLVAVQRTLSEIQQQGVAFPDSILTSEVERLSEVVDAPKLDVKHKLKVTVPIIPVFLSYEGEVELKSGLNLEAVWQRLVGRVRDT